MPPKKSNGKRVPVSSLKHKDKRTNIPTRELQNFVKDEEKSPKTVSYPGLLYARDPSLDPQLVWKGKDEQDQKPLEVPTVPVYIQEKIHPLAIVEQVKAEAKKEKPSQAEIFADFNGIKFEEMVDFYHHGVNWANRMILGDSLLVMTSLAEKEGLKGKVQMIYMDPPYGIKFGSNWQVSTRKRDVKDGKAEDAVRQPEQIKAFRDTWEYGIHSYLTYLRDRLTVARQLLSETGSVFVQIGDENVHLVRSLMDEVFGSQNICAELLFQKTGSTTGEKIQTVCDYLLWYAKEAKLVRVRRLLTPKYDGDLRLDITPWLCHDGTTIRRLTEDELANPALRRELEVFQPGPLNSQHPSKTRSCGFVFEGQEYYPPEGRQWTYDPARDLPRLMSAGRLMRYGKTLRARMYINDLAYTDLTNVWLDTQFGGFSEPQTYIVQTGQKTIQRCLLMTTEPGDLVLDPTCGSGTTAYVAEMWGRRWITIDTSRVALALARTRLMAAKFPYYHLADTREGYDKEQELSANPEPAPERKFATDIRKGFVYKRVPHVTLKSIANNEEIDATYAKWQEKLEPLRKELNKALKQSW